MECDTFEFIRTIHHIGQGAFYTEQFKDRDDKPIATVVYDCGSDSRAKISEGKEKYVQNCFPKGTVIDVLFISHLHADHINGISILIKEYNIKTVVLPYLEDIDKIMFLFDLESINPNNETFDSFKDLIINPISFFNSESHKETKVLFIDPVLDAKNEGEERFVEDIDTNSNISNGQRLKLNRVCPWLYIPLYCNKNERKEEFQKKIKAASIEWPTNRLDIFDPSEKVMKEKIKKLYGQKGEKINENSMMLYSGANEHFHSRGIPRKLLNLCPWLDILNYTRLNSSCLYTGDVSMKAIDIDRDIINIIGKDRATKISLIQVPHHGSKMNYDEKIFNISSNRPLYFLSCGINNNYGHPSSETIYEFNKRHKPLYCVTDDPDRQLIFRFKVELKTVTEKRQEE